MKARILVIYFLLVGSLLAQITTSSPVPPSKSKAPTDISTPGGTSAVDPAKEADIRRLMELAGTATLAVQMMDAMETNIRPLMKNALPPGEYREKLIDLFFAKFHLKAEPRQILDLAVPVYDKYYTDAEIKGLIQFYERPLGRKMASLQPKTVAELQESGRKWGEQLGRDSMIEVLSEHPELATALEAAKKGILPPE